jgi:dehydrogenase/reductase SDR family protein 12
VTASAARAVDAALEASVVGSFTRIGYLARRRLFAWTPLAGLRLDGKVAVVTGATSGIGFATAEIMGRNGARVCIVGRDRRRTERAQDALRESGAEVEAELADLSSLAETAALADRLAARHNRIDVLVLNAGALLHTYTETAEGNETTLATHVLSPFLLVQSLRPQLEAAAPGRVVFVASGGMYTQPLDVGRLAAGPAAYNGSKAYALCKRAQVALAEEWTRRFGAEHASVNAMHPGWADTRALRDALPRFSRTLGPLLRTAPEAADTVVWLAAAPDAVGGGGSFYLDRRPRAKHRLRRTRRPDEAREAGRLWDLCVDRTRSAGG